MKRCKANAVKQKQCGDCYWLKICVNYFMKYDSGFKKDYGDNAAKCPQYRRLWWKFGRPK